MARRLLLSVASADVGCWYSPCLPSPVHIPPLPHDPPAADDDSLSVGISHKHRLIQSFLIAAASLFAFSFFFLLFFYCLLRRRRRRRQQAQQLAALHQHNPPPPLDPNADDLLDDDAGPHHVWYIRTVGLDDSVIKSIAATIYKAGDGLIDGGDCAVCLVEFSDGETVKLLPKCSHAFHLSCIDTWLRSHVNCPLCRAPVVAPPQPPLAAAEAIGSISSPENAQIEIENQEECAIAIDSAAAASSSSGPLDRDENGDVQPNRRSVSMDSSSLGMLLLRVEPVSYVEEKLEEGKRQSELVANKNKGKLVAECLERQQQGSEMKRSLSSRSRNESGRLFLSRYARGRGRSASVLPL